MEGHGWAPSVFPYAGLAIGTAMSGLGLWLLITHRTLGIMAASRVTVSPQRNLRNVFLFGIAYAIGSLGCTLPVFLVVVGGPLGSQDLLTSFVQFIGYGLGMGTILIAVTVGAALFRGAVAKGLRAGMPHVHRISALFLVGAGAYLVYYWLFIADSLFQVTDWSNLPEPGTELTNIRFNAIVIIIIRSQKMAPHRVGVYGDAACWRYWRYQNQPGPFLA